VSDCIFCRIASGDIPAIKVFEDEQVVAFRDIEPKAAVHILLIPKQHIASLMELNREHDALMAHMVALLPMLARAEGLEQEGFRTIINTGKMAGQEVFHLHIHLLGGSSLPGF
jgi:histidine triad (HIT) family protein